MKILLIQPKMNKRSMDTDLKTRMSPSLALLTLMTLTPEGHEVALVNENVERLDPSRQADLVGITVTLDVLPRAAQIARSFRARGVPVIAGGVHVTCRPEECLEYFDAVCVGAAERVWRRVVEDAQNGRVQRVYRDYENLGGDEIASPAYDRVDGKKYLFTNVVSTSRGCPNKCDFCYNSCANHAYVRRPNEDVLNDLAALGTRHVMFVDDNFIASPARTRELLVGMRGKNLVWSAAVTTKIVDYPDILDLMSECGCQSLFIGIESVNGESLAGVNKDNDVEDYDRLVREIHDRGIMINASMVFGLDGDGPDVFKKSLDWLVKHKIETLTSHVLTPYPGTALHERMERTGRITSRDLSLYNTSHVVFRPSGMSAGQLRDGYLWMYRKFYSFSNILRRMPKNRSQRAPYLMFNLVYRKFGPLTSAIAKIVPMGVVGRVAAKISYRL
jgi:radical SAM superfamily enzyme YgiQ (UPF0313 family)